jgi:hypothetical protein
MLGSARLGYARREVALNPHLFFPSNNRLKPFGS